MLCRPSVRETGSRGRDLGGVVSSSFLGCDGNHDGRCQETLSADVDGAMRHKDVVVREDDVLVIQILGHPERVM